MLSQLKEDNDLDFPSGGRNSVVQDELKLPIVFEALGLYPHALNMGPEVESWAILPGGPEKWLIKIPNRDILSRSIISVSRSIPAKKTWPEIVVLTGVASRLHTTDWSPVRMAPPFTKRHWERQVVENYPTPHGASGTERGKTEQFRTVFLRSGAQHFAVDFCGGAAGPSAYNHCSIGGVSRRRHLVHNLASDQ